MHQIDYVAKEYHQTLREISTLWLTPVWLVPVVIGLETRRRKGRLGLLLRGMARWGFRVGAVGGLLLAIVVVVFWCRGFWWRDNFSLGLPREANPDGYGDIYLFGSMPNGIGFAVEWTPVESPVRLSARLRHWSLPTTPAFRTATDAYFVRADFWRLPGAYLDTKQSRRIEIGLRPWLLLSLALLLPGVWVVGYVRRRRRGVDGELGHPLCLVCSYDLYMLPEGSRCPECGAAVAASIPST
jgi:hypothetical protein